MYYKKIPLNHSQIKEVRDRLWGKGEIKEQSDPNELKHYTFNMYLSGHEDSYMFEIHMLLNYEQACDMLVGLNLLSFHHKEAWQKRILRFLHAVVAECGTDPELKYWIFNNLRTWMENPGILSYREMAADLCNIFFEYGCGDANELSRNLLVELLTYSDLITFDANMKVLDSSVTPEDYQLEY